MSEFRKWLDKTNCGAGIWTIAAYKKAWIAALEWVKNELRTNANGYFNLCRELEQLDKSNSQSDNSPQSNSPS